MTTELRRVTWRVAAVVVLVATVTAPGVLVGCARDAIPRDGDGLDVSGLPRSVREDYAVFANRCSKCHGLARPLALASREVSDAFWERYVERMRHQPGSGISEGDGIVIRRFLHFYSRAERERSQELDGAKSIPSAPSVSTSPPPTPPPPPPPPQALPPAASSSVAPIDAVPIDGGSSR